MSTRKRDAALRPYPTGWVWRGFVVGLAAVLVAPGPGAGQEPVVADTIPLALEEALERAMTESEEVRLADAGVAVAASQVSAARSAMLPQLSSSVLYTRTLASMYDTGETFTLPDSLRFDPDPTAPLEERVEYLEDMTPLAGLGGLATLFSDLPFGQEHLYTAGVSASQVVYAGGGVRAGLAMARNGVEAAEAQAAESRAELELEVKRAYWGAVLSREFETIATVALEQAERFLAEERLRFEAGRASELDVLRAEVTAANLRPRQVEAENAASLASLNLKRLVNLPLEAPVRLTTPLMASEAPSSPGVEPAPIRRAAVAAAEAGVAARTAGVRSARAAFLPTVVAQINYSRLAFPATAFGLDTDWRTDWTGSLVVQIPLFQGGERWSALGRAKAELRQARLQLRQVEEAVELEYRQALRERTRAWSEIEARRRTVEQADRVHDLTVLRYERGVGTQLEVSEARLGLLSARTNLAQALADYQLAQAEVERAAGRGWSGAVGEAEEHNQTGESR